MSIDWKNRFEPQILFRGKNYCQNGKVSRLQHSGQTYIANVSGTEEYTVEIDMENDRISHMECDCPYAYLGYDCKHMAAVLFALEEGMPAEEIPPRKLPPITEQVSVVLPWSDAIDNLSEEALRKELLHLADKNYDLRERLAFLYLKGLPAGQLQNWKADLQQMAYDTANRHGIIEYDEIDYFFTILGNFMDSKVSVLLDAEAYTDAAKVVRIVLDTAKEQVYDESLDIQTYFKCRCEDKLKTILKNAPDSMHQEILDILNNISFNTETTDGGEWKSLDYQNSIIGSESCVILKDEEYKDICRITLEKSPKYYAITCAIYGTMLHTAFCGEDNYIAVYKAMKQDLADFIDRDTTEDEEFGFYEYFVEKYS